MGKLYIGIDNGLSGGIAVLNEDGQIVALNVMPTTKNGKGKDFDVSGFAAVMARHESSGNTVAIELPTKHSPGVLALCSTWCCYGGIRAVLRMLSIRTHDITSPRSWQKLFWTTPKMPKGQKFNTKAAALKAVDKLWPSQSWLASKQCKNPHTGLVDAALIAEYARRNNL